VFLAGPVANNPGRTASSTPTRDQRDEATHYEGKRDRLRGQFSGLRTTATEANGSRACFDAAWPLGVTRGDSWATTFACGRTRSGATRPAPPRRAEAQRGPDQRREHHACGGPPPASPKPRRASGASRATATCPSSPPRSVASSTPPRPRRLPLLAPPDALTRSGPPPKIYSGRDILQELGALRSGNGLLEAFEPGGPSAARPPGLDHGALMTMAGYAEQARLPPQRHGRGSAGRLLSGPLRGAVGQPAGPSDHAVAAKRKAVSGLARAR
jgi:hypothetical protein